MKKSIALLFGVHAHQPVGNFPEVVNDAHVRCYRPFLQTLYGFPEFRFAAHFSGWLLDYLLQHFPQDMALLQEMVKRGQVEMFGAGDTEPVLAVIPYRDRVGQIDRLSAKLEKKFGYRPRGAWLTERVWEATVIPALDDCGIRYVTVDDYHFLCAGKLPAELSGFFSTEEDDKRLDLFPISEALRYRLPFSPALDAVRYIEGLAEEGGRAATVYFDDIEKFGIWPETYEWVYEKGWLKDFIAGVLASPVIRTLLFQDYHAQNKTRGIVYLPTTSYIEMNEWTLPASVASRYAEVVQQSKDSQRFEQDKPFLRGGIWKNFFSRYPESNWMHKRMLNVSQRLSNLPDKKKTPHMFEKLYEAQANDAYWHGLFGGLYLPHLRRAVYSAIVELEGLLDKAVPRPDAIRIDADLDGVEEIFLHNKSLQAVLRLDGSATICELDAYALAHNFGDTLRRQQEHYYRKMHVANDAHHNGGGIASAHDRVSFKHEISADDMRTDDFGKTLFRDHWCAERNAQPIHAHYLQNAKRDRSHAVGFIGEAGELRVEKHISVADNRLTVTYQFNSTGGYFSTEINLAMPSCDGAAGRYRHDNTIPGGFGQPLQLEEIRQIILDDDILGGSLVLSINEPVELSGHPHFTVSQSEAGFEKIMQAVTLRLSWPVAASHKKITIILAIVPHLAA